MSVNAFLFPGQGSQAVGMGKALATAHPAAARLFEDADRILGWSLTKFMWEGPEEELRRTDRTQPALYVVSCAAFEVLKETGVRPSMTAGHSVGEYAALYAAGVFDFETGLRLVKTRSETMHEASVAHPGGMAAVLGMDPALVEEACEMVRHDHKGLVSVANLNSAAQVVISGEAKALDLAIRLTRMKGAVKIVPLQVAGAWHCDLMKTAEQKLAPEVRAAKMNEPVCPVVANVTADVVTSAAEIRDLLIRQVCGSVRWYESVERMRALGATRWIEVGQGNVLCGIMKRVVKDAVTHRAGTPEEIAATAQAAAL